MTDTYEFLTQFINHGRYEDCAQMAHERWLKTKIGQGWSYGDTRDGDAKQNPLMLPFTELPAHIQGINSLAPYAVANYLRTNQSELSLTELSDLIKEILDGDAEELLDHIGEYVHSHFIIRMLAEGESTRTRRDMVVYQDLDEETRSWDIQIALEVLEFIMHEIRKRLGQE